MSRQAGPQRIHGVGREEGGFHTNRSAPDRQLPDMLDRKTDGIKRARCLWLDGRAPEAAKLHFRIFHQVPDVDGVVRPALGVDQDWQIAGDPDGVELVKEREPVATEQVADVMLGCDEQHVDPCRVEKTVQMAAVEGKGGVHDGVRRQGIGVDHDVSPTRSLDRYRLRRGCDRLGTIMLSPATHLRNLTGLRNFGVRCCRK